MTTNKYSNNEELAETFQRVLYCVKPLYASEERSWINSVGAVRTSEVNLPKFFRKNGSLKGVKVPGVGQRNIERLERILAGKEEELIEQRKAGRPLSSAGDWEIAKKDVDREFDPVTKQRDLRYLP